MPTRHRIPQAPHLPGLRPAKAIQVLGLGVGRLLGLCEELSLSERNAAIILAREVLGEKPCPVRRLVVTEPRPKSGWHKNPVGLGRCPVELSIISATAGEDQP